MARIKKTLPSVAKPKSREELLHEQRYAADSTTIESLSAKIIRGAEKPPVGTVFARDMAPDELYVNMENTVRMLRLLEKRPKEVLITLYSGHHYGWIKTTVPLMYPLSTDLAGLGRESRPREDSKEAIMAKQNRKHGTAAKAAAPKGGREVNPKTGFKTGSVGDKVGIAFLSVSTPEKQLEKVAEVIHESFKSKGKPTDKDAVERQSKSWIAFLHKSNPETYGESVRKAKAESKAETKVKAKKVPVEA